ncbi:MAG: sigma-70 family RNA polymerase sigma factor [Akkermansiaceae bacterium]|nr:sigma-70 family RNA polymerase sigma factor [Akkermansiaceae bacterium]MCF7732935.1 sigma-70 family RNA polymerase sigma factor [Akkermansiaceae bacterium]
MPTPAASPPSEAPSAAEWDAWLAHHGPRLLLFSRQQTRSHEDAQDVVQDALVRLFDKLSSGEFVGGEESWLPYLYTSIRRLAIDLSRRDDRRKRREECVAGDTEAGQRETFHPWFESDSSDDETRVQLEAGLKSLPPKFTEVIVMKIWGDQTFAQIGETLGISQNTAASRYRYGLEALKNSLGNARRRGDLSI